MVPLCPALGHQLVTHAYRKRQIRQSVAMQVPEFPSAEAKLGAAESMWHGRHPRPR